MIIRTKYDLYQTVYIDHDEEQKPRMITSITFDGTTQYRLSCGDSYSWHYEQEINPEKNILKSLN